MFVVAMDCMTNCYKHLFLSVWWKCRLPPCCKGWQLGWSFGLSQRQHGYQYQQPSELFLKYIDVLYLTCVDIHINYNCTPNTVVSVNIPQWYTCYSIIISVGSSLLWHHHLNSWSLTHKLVLRCVDFSVASLWKIPKSQGVVSKDELYIVGFYHS